MAATPDRKLHAVLRQTPDGLFKAEYAGEINPMNPDERDIPDCHLGTDAAEVEAWVEQMAKGMGLPARLLGAVILAPMTLPR